MRKPIISMVLGLIALVVLAVPALAGREWCAKDPIVALNGHEVQILVAVPEDMQAAVTGPIDVKVKTPRGVTQELLFTDSGFNGHGETVTFVSRGGSIKEDGSFKAKIDVSIPVDTSLLPNYSESSIPMLVTIIDGDETIVSEGSTDGMNLKVTVGEP